MRSLRIFQSILQCSSTRSAFSRPRTSRTSVAASAPRQMRSSSSLKASRFLVAGAPSGAAAQVGAVAPRSHASRERSGPPRAVTRNRSFGFFFRFVGGGASSRAWTASKDPGGGAMRLSSMACASGYSPRCGANSSSVLTMSARRSSVTS